MHGTSNGNKPDQARVMPPSADALDLLLQQLRSCAEGMRNETAPEPPTMGPSELETSSYVAELCEGLMMLPGMVRLPRLSYLLMLTHALASEYCALPQTQAKLAAG